MEPRSLQPFSPQQADRLPKKKGLGKEQIQIIRPEVKEMADKINTQSLLKRTFVTFLIELVITQFLTSMHWPASQADLIQMGTTLAMFGTLFLSFYILLVQLELLRIQLSDLQILEDLYRKLGDILMR